MDSNMKDGEALTVTSENGEEVQVYYLSVPETSGESQVLDLANILANEGIQIVEAPGNDETLNKELQSAATTTIVTSDGFVVNAGQVVQSGSTDQSTTQSAHALLKLSESLSGAQVEEIQVSDLLAAQRRTEEHIEIDQQPTDSNVTYILDNNGTMIPYGQYSASANQPLKCELCQKEFQSQAKLSSHQRSAHPYGMPWECPECGRRFSKKIGLKVHLRAHTDLKQHKCTHCERIFSYKNALARHMRLHTKEKPYKCSICGEGFSQHWAMRRHRASHKPASMYQCEVCAKMFKQKQTLLIHARVHTGHKPYSCEICRKAFTLKSSLNQHLRIHTGERPKVCPICYKAFRQTSTLNSHMKLHTHVKPHKCRYCKMRFETQEEVTSHERIHVENKSWSCDDCGMSNHNQHARASDVWNFLTKIESDPDHVICKFCNMKLRYMHSTTSNLKRHLERKHRAEFSSGEANRAAAAISEPVSTTITIPASPAPVKKPMYNPAALNMKMERTKCHLPWSEKKLELDKLLLKMIALDSTKLSMVDEIGFRLFVRALDPRYRLPSNKQLTTEMLPNMEPLQPAVMDSWQYFLTDPAEAASVTCRLCKKKLKLSELSDTTLRGHLEKKHPYEYFGEEKVLGPDGKPRCTRTPGYPKTSERKAELDRLLIRMIVLDMQKLSLVEDIGFRKFVRACDSQYELPSRRRLTRELLSKLYQEKKDSLMEQLASAKNVAITTDVWTAQTKQEYLTLSAHFVTPDFKMGCYVLSTSSMPQQHTAVTIAPLLRATFQTWNLTEKVQVVVTDTSANMLSAITQELKLTSVPCFAHSLNLVMEESLRRTEVVEMIRRKVKQIVSLFQENEKTVDERLKFIQEKYGIWKKLINEVESRWHTTSLMLKQYLKLHKPVTCALCDIARADMCINESEIKVTKLILDTLEPFELVTDEMTNEKNVSLSKMIPYVKLLQRALASLKHPDFPLVIELQHQLWLRFASLEYSFIASASTILDPRFKRLHFTDKDAMQRTEDQLKEMVVWAYHEEKSCKIAEEESQQAPPKRKSIWDAHDLQVNELIKKAPTQITGAQTEMLRYIESPLLKRDQDPLHWWRQRQRLMPQLSRLAQQFLGIPATSVPAERLFSKAGEMLSAKRASLKISNVDQLLFLNRNVEVFE